MEIRGSYFDAKGTSVSDTCDAWAVTELESFRGSSGEAVYSDGETDGKFYIVHGLRIF